MYQSHDFPPIEKSVPQVRTFLACALRGEGAVEAVVHDVMLLGSELASNVVRHARTPFTVSIAVQPHAARVEVRDGSSVLPAARELSEELYDGGRGLHILSQVALEWGVDHDGPGKVVWFEVALER